MKFTELQSILERKFNTSKLADIAHEFDVTPQVVSNWKARNQVPYKYIKKLRKKLSNHEIDLNKIEKNNQNFEEQQSSDFEEIIKNFIYYYNLTIKNKVIFLISVILSLILSLIFITFFLHPKYESNARLLPSTTQSSNLTGLASQFGFNLRNDAERMSLVSADLYPEIIKSRKLGKLVLYDDFITKNMKNLLKLINILNDTPDGRTEFDDNAIKEALLKLQGMIQILTKTSFNRFEHYLFRAKIMQ